MAETGITVSRAEMERMDHRMTVLKELVSRILILGVDYGVLPGQKKDGRKVLLKSGAEKLCTAFEFRPKASYKIVEMANGHREYTFDVEIFSSSGAYLGFGVGSCSTMETKYRWRGAFENTGELLNARAYFQARDDGNKAEMLRLLGGKKEHIAKKDPDSNQWMIFRKSSERQENTDIADVYNTVLKMAKKRGLVDAVLTVTNASDLFTQDIEEQMEDREERDVTPPSGNEPAPHPDPAPQQQAQPPKDQKKSKAIEEHPAVVSLVTNLAGCTDTKMVDDLALRWDEWYEKMTEKQKVANKECYDYGKKLIDQRIADMVAPETPPGDGK